MSKVSISGDQNGTGNFTIKAPATNTDRTLTLPDEEGTVATIENIPPGYEDQDALDLFNATGSAPVYACRAWVNFDGTGTVSIQGAGNVSSITDIEPGKYVVNLATSLEDKNYAVVALSLSTGKFYCHADGEGDANSIVIQPRNTNQDPVDSVVAVAFFR